MCQHTVDNTLTFERDVLRDFCLGAHQLREQFARFEKNGTLSFSLLSSLVGTPLRKGLFWRLKDTAHHLFRRLAPPSDEGLLLDWTLGYIFHEALKLTEDAHQLQFYLPQLELFRSGAHPGLSSAFTELEALHAQTRESICRENRRLEHLFTAACGLFCLYFARRKSNRLLARLLYDRASVIREVFGDAYPDLTGALYGQEPELLYIEAAVSLYEGGRYEPARASLDKALNINPVSSVALELYARLQPGQADIEEE